MSFMGSASSIEKRAPSGMMISLAPHAPGPWAYDSAIACVFFCGERDPQTSRQWRELSTRAIAWPSAASGGRRAASRLLFLCPEPQISWAPRRRCSATARARAAYTSFGRSFPRFPLVYVWLWPV